MIYLFILSAGLGAALALPGFGVAEPLLATCVGIECTNVIRERRTQWKS